jgi:uncharacterized protein (DUF934 family)
LSVFHFTLEATLIMKLLLASELPATEDNSASTALQLPNDADPRTLNLKGVQRIDLHFPKFTDGRAYSQAFWLRKRLNFKGEIRATGDVLTDQVLLMSRCGFDTAVLRADQQLASAERQLHQFSAFYQGDALTAMPHFARA